MEIDLIGMLAEYGSMGLFVIYLVWSSQKASKAEAERVTSFQEQLDRYLSDYKADIKEIRLSSKEEVDNIRGRYDVVLASYSEEKTQVRQNISSRVKDLGQRITNLENEVKGVMINTENILNSIKDIANENKLRDLAKAAQVSRIMGAQKENE
tara:strand:+ start:797 stop:1255 length:459 start_codon:yes stop_codon:yes gene_type:complete